MAYVCTHRKVIKKKKVFSKSKEATAIITTNDAVIFQSPNEKAGRVVIVKLTPGHQD